VNKAILHLVVSLFWISAGIGSSAAAQRSKPHHVSGDSADFSLTLESASQTVNAGGRGAYMATIRPFEQDPKKSFGSVSLSVSGLPECAHGDFHPQQLVFVEWTSWNMPYPKEVAGDAELVISTSYSCQAGSYKLTITARHGTAGPTHEVGALLVIKPAIPDFSLKVTAKKTESVEKVQQSKATLLIGGEASYVISVEPIGDYKGTIALKLGSLPEGVAAELDRSEIDEAGTAKLRVSTGKSTLRRGYTLFIKGEDSKGKLVHEGHAELIVYPAPPEFSLNVSGDLERTFPGSTASGSVTVNSEFGYEGSVALSLEGLPAGVTGTLDPPYVAVSAEGSGLSTLKLFIGDNAAPGYYGIKITGVSKGGKEALSSTTERGLTVYSSDYSFAATPEEQTVVAGDSASYTTTVTPIKNDEGLVKLSLWSGLPFAKPVFIPSSLPANQGALSSILTVSTDPWTRPGTYDLYISSANPHRSPGHTVKAKLVVTAPTQDFLMTVSSPEQTTSVGGGTSYVVNLDSIAGYKGSVSLDIRDLPVGATASFSQDSLMVDRRFLMSVLTIFTSDLTPTGSYTLKLEAVTPKNDGARKHVVPLKLLVSERPH
jgi:hypothetical protein